MRTESRYGATLDMLAADWRPDSGECAAGRLDSFRASFGFAQKVPRKGIRIDRDSARMLEVDIGDQVLAVSRNGSH